MKKNFISLIVCTVLSISILKAGSIDDATRKGNLTKLESLIAEKGTINQTEVEKSFRIAFENKKFKIVEFLAKEEKTKDKISPQDFYDTIISLITTKKINYRKKALESLTTNVAMLNKLTSEQIKAILLGAETHNQKDVIKNLATNENLQEKINNIDFGYFHNLIQEIKCHQFLMAAKNGNLELIKKLSTKVKKKIIGEVLIECVENYDRDYSAFNRYKRSITFLATNHKEQIKFKHLIKIVQFLATKRKINEIIDDCLYKEFTPTVVRKIFENALKENNVDIIIFLAINDTTQERISLLLKKGIKVDIKEALSLCNRCQREIYNNENNDDEDLEEAIEFFSDIRNKELLKAFEVINRIWKKNPQFQTTPKQFLSHNQDEITYVIANTILEKTLEEDDIEVIKIIVNNDSISKLISSENIERLLEYAATLDLLDVVKKITDKNKVMYHKITPEAIDTALSPLYFNKDVIETLGGGNLSEVEEEIIKILEDTKKERLELIEGYMASWIENNRS